MNSFDIDGVLDFEGTPGVYPGPNDVIITGRSFEEFEETEAMLRSRGIENKVYYNTLKFDDKTRETSGQHKGRIISMLKDMGYGHQLHFEDDPIQIEEILKIDPTIKVVHVKSDLVELENKKR